MTGTIWSNSGRSYIIGGHPGAVLASAGLLADAVSQGLAAQDRRVQRATNLLARLDAGESIDEVDTEFLEKFIEELKARADKEDAAATAKIARRAQVRHAKAHGTEELKVRAEFAKWQLDNFRNSRSGWFTTSLTVAFCCSCITFIVAGTTLGIAPTILAQWLN